MHKALKARAFGWLSRNWLLLLAGLALVTVVGRLAVEVAAVRASLDCSYINGCFQLFNPLRRLADGQSVGSDFNFFYGPGSLWAFYPLFVAVGGNLFASELSRLVLPHVLLAIACLSLGLALFRGWRAGLAAAATGLLLALGSDVAVRSLVEKHAAIRAFLPFVAVAVAVTPLDSQRGGWLRRWLLVGFLLGLGLTVSPDLGAVALAAALVASLVAGGGFVRGLARSAAVLASAAVSAVASWLLVTGAGWSTALRFHLVDLPGDQLWYFGAPPNPTAASFLELLSLRHVTVPALLLLGCLAATWLLRKRQSEPADRWAVVFLSLFGLGSLVPYLGMVYMHYSALAQMAAVVVLAILGVRFLYQPALDRPDVRQAARHAAGTAQVLAAFALVALSFSGVLQASAVWRDTVSEPDALDARLGVGLPAYWQELVDVHNRVLTGRFADAERQPEVWSTYSSVLEARQGIFHPHTDYIIHALGPEARASYVRRFAEDRPELVRTVPGSELYANWLWQANWDFFELLLLNYRPVERAEYGQFWIRNGQPWRPSLGNGWIEGAVAADGRSAAVPLSTVSMAHQAWVLEIEYQVQNPYAAWPVLGGSPRVLLEPSGGAIGLATSLPPNRRSFRTLVRMDHSLGVEGRLDLRVESVLPGIAARLVSARWQPLGMSAGQAEFLFGK